MPPRFSVVIPTFNRSDLFPYTVQSILNQTFEDFEIILSDNCSSDDTQEVARQFKDPRFKYVRTPRHFTIADSCEFVRMQASGRSIILLSDDDAFVNSALERFAAEAGDFDADLLFSSVAEYRNPSYPGPDKNTFSCPRFSGSSRVVSADEFVRPLFSLRPKFSMHPSGFVFPKKIADYVESRTGRFFWTNGVEYSAWPICALLAKRIVHIDLPLAILGRTAKSYGVNIALCNPGKERIQEFIKDVDHERKHAPLNNFTMCNLMAEGILAAKSLFPEEFESYEFDELEYLRKTLAELRRRQALGVDVSTEMDDLRRYAAKYPGFDSTELPPRSPATQRLARQLRSVIGDLGARSLRRRLQASQLARRLERGPVQSGFYAYGEDFGFFDVLGCAEFLSRCTKTNSNTAKMTTHQYYDSISARL